MMRTWLWYAAVVWWAGIGLGTAGPVPASPVGLPPILSKVFGDLTGFSAQARVRVEGQSAEESMQVPMTFSYLNGHMRAEIDMARIQSASFPTSMVASLQKIGMDRVVTIVGSPDQPSLILYPNLKAGVEVAPPREELPPPEGQTESVRQVKLGSETVSGRPCDHYRFIHRDRQGATHEALVWRDPDLNQFPLQIQVRQAGATVRVLFGDVRLQAPAADQFELPADFKRHREMQTILRDAMQRLRAEP